MGVGQSSCLLKEVKEWIFKTGSPLEIAISTITSNPADILRLKGKGKVEEGYDAALLVGFTRSCEKGNCVIVGRCVDYILRNSENCLKVFFSAPLVSRIRRVAQRQNISEGEAKATVQKNEKLRADNYRYYTRRMWGAAGNFDLSLNTDLGEEFIENCIRSAMKL